VERAYHRRLYRRRRSGASWRCR